RKELHHDVRSSGFMAALWGMEDFITAENTVIRVEFLGYNIRIHPEIQNSLIQVEKGILRAVQTDEDAARWLDNISDAGAYVWRDIAGSGNRSLHSYGIAVDLIPGDYQGKQAYWRWAADYYEKWWAIPYAERFHVPDIIVKTFEENGFIWGGKWFLFDQIHFEYRPELLILGK
ncbi:MAG: M15 family metallopeptidase, partial [Spirochaetaceae bacterium]|nr:M15 family metallopeptidase [Spirochaetaceae bacterium]